MKRLYCFLNPILKGFSKKTLGLLGVSMLGIQFSANAIVGYCTPSISYTNIHLSLVQFDDPVTGSIISPNVVSHSTSNNGYSIPSGSPFSTYYQGHSHAYHYGVYNPTSSPKKYYINVWADWNNDGDFNDKLEHMQTLTETCPGLSSQTSGGAITPELTSYVGNVRMRFTVSESNITDPCGTFSEVEDYLVTVGPNTAPVLNNAGTPFLNVIKEDETANEGYSINTLIMSTSPDVTMITDANDAGAAYTSQMPRGIAIYSQTSTNGTWQYKIGAGNWTNFGSVSASNALLLLADSYNTNYQPNARIRFVPSGPGTPSFNFRAWDGTSGLTGNFANITSTGTTTSYSTATETVSLTVAASANYSAGTKMFYATTDKSALQVAEMDRLNSVVNNPKTILSGNPSYKAGDIALDAINNKIYWTDYDNYYDVHYSNLDGTGFQTISTADANGISALAVGGNKLFTSGYSGIMKSDLNGSNSSVIYNSDLCDIGDVEYYNNKIYFVYSHCTDGTYQIVQTNIDGTSKVVMYDGGSASLRGLTVANDTIYWTENVYSTQTAYIKKKAISGGSAITVNTQIGSSYADIVIDPTTKSIYVLDNDVNNSSVTGIRKMTFAGTNIQRVSYLEGAVNSLAFDNSALAVAPSFTTNPSNSTICAGNSTSFTIVADNATSYKWQEYITSWNDLTATGVFSGVTSTTLQISNVTGLNGRQYRCVATGSGSTNSTAATLTVSEPAVATFSYVGSPYCITSSNPSPTFSGGGIAGTFSSTSGLAFVSTSTGQVNLSISTPGTYTVTNTIAASSPCALQKATTTITITGLQLANFSYTGTPYCSNSSNPIATLSGSSAGTFSSTTGLAFVSTSTGEVDLSTSIPGTYTVTNTLAANGGCASKTATSSITINGLPDTTIAISANVISANKSGANYVWFDCDAEQIIANENAQSYKALVDGSYSLYITDAVTNCTHHSACVDIKITGIEENTVNTIAAYPNPVLNGELTVETNKAGSLEISNVQGVLLLTTKISEGGNTINTNSLSGGIYIVKIKSENGELIKTIKITIN